MKNALAKYEAVIGLEIHCQLATRTKLFCGCPTKLVDQSVGEIEPNLNVCPVCAGHPGTLPVLNEKVVELALRAGLALGCRIPNQSVFARKNYFYPDLPKGYQISQYEEPLCAEGSLEVRLPSGEIKRVGIQRIHVEEDAGKNVHHAGYSLVNLNRAGVPLIEIVSAPDLRTAVEAGAYLRTVHSIVTAIGVTDGNMQEGNFRCDANVSVRMRGETRLGTRTEIKNVNSFRFVEKAIDFEIARQIGVLEAGGKVIQETRGYEADRHMTYSMRSKEEAEDYRYFADPDLIEVQVDESFVARVRDAIPELPPQKLSRFISELGLSQVDAETLLGSPELLKCFEQAAREAGAALAKSISHLLVGEVTRLMTEKNQTISSSALEPGHLVELVRLAQAGEISSTGVKTAIGLLWERGGSVEQIVSQAGLRQVSDLSALEPVIRQVLADHPAQVAEVQAGKEKVLGFLVGQVMKRSGGQANPALVQQWIRKQLLKVE